MLETRDCDPHIRTAAHQLGLRRFLLPKDITLGRSIPNKQEECAMLTADQEAFTVFWSFPRGTLIPRSELIERWGVLFPQRPFRTRKLVADYVVNGSPSTVNRPKLLRRVKNGLYVCIL
jgi:hypothetical protein